MKYTIRQLGIMYLILLFFTFVLGGLFVEVPDYVTINTTITMECVKGWNQTFDENTIKVCGKSNPLRKNDYVLNLSNFNVT